MRASEIVQKFMAALEHQQWDEALITLSPDFTSSGWVSRPLGKEDWLSLSQSLAAAMPDWSFGFHLLREQGSTVWGMMHFSGTQTRDLALPLPGIDPIAATSRRVELPEEEVEFTVNDERIRAMRLESWFGAGLPGIVSKLRAENPEEASPSAPPTGPDRIALIKEIPMRDPHSIEG